ncbi:MAG: tail length tape measure protein [Pseudooceanicola sp.]|nr:tail length tape measure protein [Pseudooceanicola sp.]
MFALTFESTGARAALDRTTSSLCDQAAMKASRRHDVPLDVMAAITRTETGRGSAGELFPWPWTVNMEGAGRWFETRTSAEAFARANHAQGARSFDVGCFQINYKWHAAAFASLEDMFDPAVNADYAARFLAELFAEFGDWKSAAGAFHSRSPEFANIYEARFQQIRQSLNAAEVSGRQRSTGFGPSAALDLVGGLVAGPFLGSGNARLGSLVPLEGRGATSPSRFSLFH